MVSLGRPGAGESLLGACGFVEVERIEVPFAWEFPDPEIYARALASTGPAYEAIQNVGEEAFHWPPWARAPAGPGRPSRCEPRSTSSGTWPASRRNDQKMTAGFLEEPTNVPAGQALYDEDSRGERLCLERLPALGAPSPTP